MKNHRCLLAVAVLATALGSVSKSHGAITQVTLSSVGAGNTSGIDMAYSTDVSSTDLLHGIAGTYSGWQRTEIFTPANLNNGSHGTTSVGANPDAIAFAADSGTVATYLLGAGDGWGYGIESVVSIAAWRDSALYQQHYQIWTRTLGNTTFDLVYTVANDLSPVSDLTSGGSTKVTVSDTNGGYLAYGVDAIRFVILDIPSSFEPQPGGGSTAFREIDVIGASIVPEPSSALLFLGGGLAALGIRRRSRLG